MVLIFVSLVLQCVLTLWADIYECPDGTCNCHPGRPTYDNNVDSLTCSCKSGYTKNGTLCTDIDECADDTHICHPGLSCDVY